MVLRHLRGDEGLAVGDLHERIVRSLMADGGELAVSHTGSAHRAGTMGRVDDGLISQVFELAQAIEQQAGHLPGPVRVEIRAAHITDKERITGKYTHGALFEFGVIQREGQVVIGMPGGFQHADACRADVQAIAFAYGLGIAHRFCGVRPVPHLGAGQFGQHRSAGDKVLVAVGFQNVGDLHAPCSCALNVTLTVTLGIDHRRRAVAANQVGQMRQAFGLDGFNDHGMTSLGDSCPCDCAAADSFPGIGRCSSHLLPAGG